MAGTPKPKRRSMLIRIGSNIIPSDDLELGCLYGKAKNIHSLVRHSTIDFPDSLPISHIARLIVEEVIPSNPTGFTWDPRKLKLFSNFDEETYIVSLHGYGREFNRMPNEQDVRSWLIEKQLLLSRLGNYIGGWLNPQNGKFYLDLSIAICGCANAIVVGNLNHQESIYHPATGRNISLNPTAYVETLTNIKNSYRLIDDVSTIIIASQICHNN